MPGPIILSENKEGAQLDALAQRVLRGSRIGERRVGSEAATAPNQRESKHLSNRTSSRAFPAHRTSAGGLWSEVVGSRAYRDDKLGGDEVFWYYAARVANGKRRSRTKECRPPQIDDGDAAAKQFVSRQDRRRAGAAPDVAV
jgi:hypothetical protein